MPLTAAPAPRGGRRAALRGSRAAFADRSYFWLRQLAWIRSYSSLAATLEVFSPMNTEPAARPTAFHIIGMATGPVE